MKQTKVYESKLWQKGLALVLDCYKLSRCIPHNESWEPGTRLRRTADRLLFHLGQSQGKEDPGDSLLQLRAAQDSAAKLNEFLQHEKTLNFMRKAQSIMLLRRVAELSSAIRGLQFALHPAPGPGFVYEATDTEIKTSSK